MSGQFEVVMFGALSVLNMNGLTVRAIKWDFFRVERVRCMERSVYFCSYFQFFYERKVK